MFCSVMSVERSPRFRRIKTNFARDSFRVEVFGLNMSGEISSVSHNSVAFEALPLAVLTHGNHETVDGKVQIWNKSKFFQPYFTTTGRTNGKHLNWQTNPARHQKQDEMCADYNKKICIL